VGDVFRGAYADDLRGDRLFSTRDERSATCWLVPSFRRRPGGP